MRLLFAIIALLVVAACSAPPEDVQSAVITENLAAETPDVETEDTTDTPNGLHTGGDDGEVDTSDGERIPIDASRSSFTFTGFGPGKSHSGTFTEMSGEIMMQDGRVVAAEGIIDPASVKSDSAGLDRHLMNEDFFDVERYPTMEFSSSLITETVMIGELSFHGVTRELTIPVTHGDGSLSADFLLSMEAFGITYLGVNDEVRIEFDVRG
jgi:polyisoprenoid-binding protein YceI